jgi:hypothetical protein
LLSIPASEPENDRPALQENLAEFSAISLIATNSKTILSFLRSTGNAPHLKKGEQPIDKAANCHATAVCARTKPKSSSIDDRSTAYEAN